MIILRVQGILKANLKVLFNAVRFLLAACHQGGGLSLASAADNGGFSTSVGGGKGGLPVLRPKAADEPNRLYQRATTTAKSVTARPEPRRICPERGAVLAGRASRR